MNVKVTSPNPEELTVQNDEDTHTRISEYRALMPGTPQRGQLLSPRHTDKASSWVLMLSRSSPPGRKRG